MLDKSGLRGAVQAASLVTEFAVLTVVGLFVGSQLDKWLDTAPWLLFLFTLAGFIAGNAVLFTGIQRLLNDDDADDHPP